MTSYYFLISIFIKSNKNTTYWYFFTTCSFLCLFQSLSHPKQYLFFFQFLSIFLHIETINIKINYHFGFNSVDKKSEYLFFLLNLQMQETKINLKHYVSVVSYLAFKCAQIVKDCAENPNLKKYDKGVDDPVTDADYKIQTFIIKGLNHFFPKLRIVGEETTQYKGQIQLNFQQVTFDNFPKNSHIQQSVPISELCVWIDPIDNTKGFIEDRLQGVTILIGLTRNMKAYLGIVTTPYTVQQNHRIFRPRVNIGNVSSHEAYVSYQLGKWTQIERPPVNKPLRFVTSDRRKNQAIELISKKNEAILSKMGGSGNKLNMVIFGQADVALYLGQGNCRWDSCANEAIVLSLGGCFSNQNGQVIVYDPNAKSFGNTEGNVCLFDKQLHKSIIEDIAAFHGKKVGKL